MKEEVIIHKGKNYDVRSGHGRFTMKVSSYDRDTVTGTILVTSSSKELEELFPGGLITVRRCNASFK